MEIQIKPIFINENFFKHIKYLIMNANFDQIKQLVADCEDDVNKFFENGNKAAGSRIRKSMQSIKKLAQEVRVEVQAAKNAAKAQA